MLHNRAALPYKVLLQIAGYTHCHSQRQHLASAVEHCRPKIAGGTSQKMESLGPICASRNFARTAFHER